MPNEGKPAIDQFRHTSVCIAVQFAEDLRARLAADFTVAAWVREVAGGKGFRIYRVRQPKNRDLADVRSVDALPPIRLIESIRVPTPEELIAQEVLSLALRSAQPKGDSDRRDVKVLLLAYPDLKSEQGLVAERLLANGAGPDALRRWGEIAAMAMERPGEDDEFEKW